MYILKIETIGEISLPSKTNAAVGFQYDIPTDDFGIPYLPMAELINSKEISELGVKLSFAHPDGYQGLLRSASLIEEKIPDCTRFIKAYFMGERFIREKQYSIRYLRAGLIFKAGIFFSDSEVEKIREALARITHIGITDYGITGEVSVMLCEEPDVQFELTHSAQCRFTSVDISYQMITPTCFYTPYSDGAKTALYIPGAVIKDKLLNNMGEKLSGGSEGLIFSNAYISDNGKRFLPTPTCVSVVKLDREQLRYRLAPGKDPRITEQDVGLEGTYVDNVCEQMVSYTAPETVYINSSDGVKYEALSAGQVFKGTIYGTDEQIRSIIDYVSDHPYTHLGTLSNEGFGETLQKIDCAKGKKLPAENLSRCFDLCCVSDTLIINEKGMPTCRAEDLVKEIEYVLGMRGKLRIVGKYTNIFSDFSREIGSVYDRPVTRCLAKGSVLRLETVGEPIDISKISHCFIGERTGEGYGEILSYPSCGDYYRIAKKLILKRYSMHHTDTCRDTDIGATFTNSVITSVAKSRIRGVAMMDREEYAKGFSADELVSEDILSIIKDRLAPSLSLETMVRWYKEYLEETKK